MSLQKLENKDELMRGLKVRTKMLGSELLTLTLSLAA